MSNKFNEPWTLAEKIGLLLNVLQGHTDVLSLLHRALLDQGITAPRWDVIALPEGRTLGACRLKFNEMIQSQTLVHSFPTVAGYGPSSFASATPQNRSYAEQMSFQPAPRAIQPRPSRSTDSPVPPTSNGESLTIVRTLGAGDFGGDKPKKRGRPTKEEAEERNRAYAAEGKVYEPKKRATKKFRASTGTPVPMSEARLPDSPALATPLPLTVETKEESSSGKRRSKRQEIQTAHLPAEPSSPTRSGTGAAPNLAESPSDRLLARMSEREPERPLSRDTQQDQSPDQPATQK